MPKDEVFKEILHMSLVSAPDNGQHLSFVRRLSPFLTSLSVYQKNKISNAGALMFASKVGRFIPHFRAIFYRDPRYSLKAEERLVGKGVESWLKRLGENEKIIYDLIKVNPSISKREIMLQGRLTKKTVDYNIEKLKEKGFIKRVGPAKGGHWEIV